MLALLGCQLAGETLARLLALPVPGPVIGMALLLAWLSRGGEAAPDSPVIGAADALLRHLSLLFVPAAVGLMQYFPLIAHYASAIAAAVALSTFAAMIVTALTFNAAARWLERRRI